MSVHLKPFPRVRHLVLLVLVMAGLLPAAPASAGPLQPKITLSDAEGMAPFTVHVHALKSALGAGDALTARYEWNFGDGGSRFNALVGWNAAHTYDQPGEYTIRLRITNQAGQTASVTRHVHVTQAARHRVYVSPNGSDWNPGSITSPVRSIGRAAELVNHNTIIYFERGGVYNTDTSLHIDHRNVVVTAYGNGPKPILRWTTMGGFPALITMGWWSKDVVVEDLAFDTVFEPSNWIARGVHPHGDNITVRDCRFDRVSYAMNTEFGVDGFLAQDNDADDIGAYFIWAIGSDHTYLGNTVGGCRDEHTIRLAGAARVLIARNDLRNTSKSNVWCMLGRHCYIAENVLRDGRVLFGPNFAGGYPEERFRKAVAEGNLVINEGFILYPGAEQLMLRNNIVRATSRDAFSIWGYDSAMNRAVREVALLHNTVINHSDLAGCFLRIGGDAYDIEVMNNLYLAESLNTNWSAANVASTDSDLATHVFKNNLWSNPTTGQVCHFLDGGGVPAPQWKSLPQTDAEAFRSFQAHDLDGQYRPRFNARRGRALASVRFDYYGQRRPAQGMRNVGAVEQD